MDKVQEEQILEDECKPIYILYNTIFDTKPVIGFVFESFLNNKQYIYEIELENLEELPLLSAESLAETLYSQHQFLKQYESDKMTDYLKKASGEIIQAIESKKSKLAKTSEGSAQKVPVLSKH